MAERPRKVGLRQRANRAQATGFPNGTPLPALQLRDLHEIPAAVLQDRNGRPGHVGRRHRELGAARPDPLAVASQIIGELIFIVFLLMSRRLPPPSP
jgi:hypothetical protein